MTNTMNVIFVSIIKSSLLGVKKSNLRLMFTLMALNLKTVQIYLGISIEIHILFIF